MFMQFLIDRGVFLWYTIINKNKLFKVKGEGVCLFMIRIQKLFISMKILPC